MDLCKQRQDQAGNTIFVAKTSYFKSQSNSNFHYDWFQSRWTMLQGAEQSRLVLKQSTNRMKKIILQTKSIKGTCGVLNLKHKILKKARGAVLNLKIKT